MPLLKLAIQDDIPPFLKARVTSVQQSCWNRQGEQTPLKCFWKTPKR